MFAINDEERNASHSLGQSLHVVQDLQVAVMPTVSSTASNPVTVAMEHVQGSSSSILVMLPVQTSCSRSAQHALLYVAQRAYYEQFQAKLATASQRISTAMHLIKPSGKQLCADALGNHLRLELIFIIQQLFGSCNVGLLCCLQEHLLVIDELALQACMQKVTPTQ